MQVKLNTILTGKIQPLGAQGLPSAIHKIPASGLVHIGELGLQDDECGDPKHHGGPDKAIHYYPFEHYAWWRQHIQANILAAPGAFGENFSALGLLENQVCIGDIFSIGSARVQISQGRQPCGKLNLRFNTPDMARQVQTTGRTGWYLRVLTEGYARADDLLTLIERPGPDWDLATVWHYFYVDKLNYTALEALVNLPYLSDSWKKLAQTRLEQRRVESWRSRLETP